MRFSEWLLLVDEYAKEFYCFDDALQDTDMAFNSFMLGETPKEYVDAIAFKYGLDPYPDLHWGHPPPGFDIHRYNIKPSHEE